MEERPPDPLEPGITKDEWRERVLAERDYYRTMFKQVPWQLLDVGLDLRLVQKELERIAGRFDKVAAQAADEARPAVQILHLKGEVETLAKIIDETILELIHKVAEVEAKSLG
jgi:hypothetical protein